MELTHAEELAQKAFPDSEATTFVNHTLKELRKAFIEGWEAGAEERSRLLEENTSLKEQLGKALTRSF